jgi:uncharacterized protein YijF (DUF1287 family)
LRRTFYALLLVAFAAVAPAQDRRPGAGLDLARAAESQVGVTVTYDPSYVRLAFPGGDIPPDRGVCADVVVRAFRQIGVDLQVQLHEDVKRHFNEYPRLWGLRRPDPNIDHRRVPNLMTYFKRQGKALPISAPYHPGDVVAWRLSNGLHHIGVISQRRASGNNHNLVVHNIGQGARTEDVLHAFEIIGHYRW